MGGGIGHIYVPPAGFPLRAETDEGIMANAKTHVANDHQALGMKEHEIAAMIAQASDEMVQRTPAAKP